MYLRDDIIKLIVAIVWFLVGIRLLRRNPNVYHPMVGFSRYHPRLAPLLVFALVLIWPLGFWLWRPLMRWAFYIVFKFKNPKIKD